MDADPSELDAIKKAVCATIADMLCIPVTEVTTGAPMVDLGADSFQVVELSTRLDAEFDITLPRTYALSTHYTVDTLVRAVAAQVHARR